MNREPEWLTKQDVLALHEWLLAEHGGAPGLRDEGLLEAALAGPKNQFAYARSDLFEPAAEYALALTRNHLFIDGNKRIALAAAGIFLELNGHRLEAPESEASSALIALTSGQLDHAQFAAWLRDSSPAARPPQRTPARRPRGTRRKN